MTHLGLVTQFGLQMLVVVVVSTLLGLAVTALTLKWLNRRSISNHPDA